MDRSVIEIRNLTTKYGNRIVLDNIELDIHDNEIFSILGSSGGGKTTLLKNMIGLLVPFSGEIKILGENIYQSSENNNDKILKEIGVLFQNGALFNSLSVWENIGLPLFQHTDFSLEEIEIVARQKLSLVNLQYAYNLYPSELSGGMRKRVALARALALDPKILFFDEPSAGLDPITVREMDELVLSLKKDLGITLVVVTHELSSIKRISDRIMFLDKGHNIFCGTLDDAMDMDISVINKFFQS